jgi:hypothetical protein
MVKICTGFGGRKQYGILVEWAMVHDPARNGVAGIVLKDRQDTPGHQPLCQLLYHLLSLPGQDVMHHICNYNQPVVVTEICGRRREMTLAFEIVVYSADAVMGNVKAVNPQAWKAFVQEA